MALKDLVIPTVDVLVSEGNSFPVRGLSSIDIEYLMRKHGNDLKALWDEFLENKTDLTQMKVEDMWPLLKQVVSRVPEAMRDLIAVAADADESDLPKLARLGMGVQATAVGQILGLTLGTDGDWSKILETVMKMVGGANGALAELLPKQLLQG